MSDTVSMGELVELSRNPPNPEDGAPDEEVPAIGEATDDVAQAEAGVEEGTEVADEDDGEGTSLTDQDDALWSGIVDGQEHTITDRTELNQAVSFGVNYGSKIRELAEQRRVHEADVSQFAQTRQAYTQGLEAVSEYLKNPAGSPPVRDQYQTLEAYDAARTAWDAEADRAKVFTDNLAAERQGLAEQANKELSRFLEAADAQTMATVPGWNDPAVAQREYLEVLKYAVSQGADAETLKANQYVSRDPAFVVMAYKAMKYDGATEAGKTKVQAAQTKASAPGPGAETATATRGKRHRDRIEAIKDGGGKTADIAPVMGDLVARIEQLNPRR